jgi:hypothetical protein
MFRRDWLGIGCRFGTQEKIPYAIKRHVRETMLASSHAALTRTLALARELGDFDYQRRAIVVLWLFSPRAASSNDALALAHQYEELARNSDDQSRATTDAMVAMSQTFLAAHSDASVRLQRMIRSILA